MAYDPQSPSAIGSVVPVFGGGSSGALVLAGDVIGPLLANTVVGLQGVPISAVAPLAGEVLAFDGVNWVPTPVAGVASLQSAYVGGNTIAVTAGEGTVDISNNTDATTLLTLSHAFAGGGSLVSGTMGAGTTAPAISLTTLAANPAIRATDGAATSDFLASQFRGFAGTAAAPFYSFAADPNTGAYSVGADDWGVSTGGTLRFDVSTALITSTLPHVGPAGSAGAPTYSWSGDPNSGLYNVGADDVGISAGGTLRFDVSTTLVTSTLPFVGPAGSAGAPTYSFSGDPNTGAFNVGADQYGLSTGGTVRVTVANASTTFAGNVLPGNPSTFDVGAIANRWANGYFDNVTATTYTGLTLQQAYNGGNTIAVTTARGTPTISNTADTTDLLTLSRTFAGAGVSIAISHAAASSGILVTMSHASAGVANPIMQVSTPAFSTPVALRVISSTQTTDYSATNIDSNNTFVFRVSATTRLAVNTNGATVQNGTLTVPDGAVGAPGINFASSGSTGLFLSTNLLVSQGGGQIASFDFTDNSAAGTVSMVQFTPTINQSGTAAYNAVRVNVTQTGTGSGQKNLLALAVGGTDLFFVDNTGRSYAPDGSAALPSRSFTADTNTGMYRVGADDIGFATGGSLRVDIASTQLTSTVPFLGPAQIAGNPTYSFSGDTNTGMYSAGADDIGFSTNATLRLDISTTAVTSTLPYVGPAGAVGAPAFTTTGDTDTGIYFPAANQCSITTNGTQRLLVTAGLISVALEFYLINGSAATPSLSFTGDTNTGMFRNAADDIGFTTGGTLRFNISTTAAVFAVEIQCVNIDINNADALGGGAAATLGTVGGTGPTTAAQAQWLQIQINNVDHWIPVWT